MLFQILESSPSVIVPVRKVQLFYGLQVSEGASLRGSGIQLTIVRPRVRFPAAQCVLERDNLFDAAPVYSAGENEQYQ